MTALINVQRRWDGMNARESKKKFKWFLDEYAATPSGRQDVVSHWNWGSSELMALAANSSTRHLCTRVRWQQMWHCSLFKPSTTTRGNKVYETGQQVPMQLDQWITAVRHAKQHGLQRPLVLRFWGQRYSAYVHTGPSQIRQTEGKRKIKKLLTS